jgi:magnesium transporter
LAFIVFSLLTLRPSVNPLYYVTFTTATLCASFILFSGFNTTDPVGTLSLLCGFLVTFTGVYLLNLSRGDPNGTGNLARRNGGDSTGTDMISSIQTRLSLEARRSFGNRASSGNNRGGDREGLIRAYDEEEAAGFGLTDLAESDEDEIDPRSPMIGGHPQANGNANGNHQNSKPFDETIEMQPTKSGER